MKGEQCYPVLVVLYDSTAFGTSCFEGKSSMVEATFELFLKGNYEFENYRMRAFMPVKKGMNQHEDSGNTGSLVWF